MTSAPVDTSGPAVDMLLLSSGFLRRRPAFPSSARHKYRPLSPARYPTSATCAQDGRLVSRVLYNLDVHLENRSLPPPESALLALQITDEYRNLERKRQRSDSTQILSAPVHQAVTIHVQKVVTDGWRLRSRVVSCSVRSSVQQ